MKAHRTALIDNKAEIAGDTEIGPNVIIEKDVIIEPGVRIMANSCIFSGTTIGEGTVIHPGAVIGGVPQDISYKGGRSFTRIGKNNTIREYVTIHRGTEEGSSTVTGNNNYIMVQAHLGHNCRLADNIYIANGALLAGHVRVDEGAFISGNVVFHQFCRVGSYAMVGGFTGVNKDVPPYMIVRGPSIVRGINVIGLRRAGFKASDLRQIKKAYRLIYLSGEPLEKALEKLEGTDAGPHVKVLVDFIISSKRGICKAKEKNGDFFD